MTWVFRLAHALPGAMRPHPRSPACTSTRRTHPTVGEPRLSAVLGGKPMSRSNGEVVSVRIIPNEKSNPPGKLADAEVIFEPEAGPLNGLKLIGFSVWERRSGGGRNVTFPARQYSVNGERRSFALLRPIGDATAQDRIRDLVLQAYADHEEAASA